MLVDQLCWAPVGTAAFFAYSEFAQGHGRKELSEKLGAAYKDVMITNWAFWPAFQTLNFKFVPGE